MAIPTFLSFFQTTQFWQDLFGNIVRMKYWINTEKAQVVAKLFLNFRKTEKQNCMRFYKKYFYKQQQVEI